MSLASGSKLGPYEIGSPIGAGGMGEVFRARDTKLSRDVAIKVLPAALAHDTERVTRFRREAQLVAALNHPNIAAIYGLEESNGVVALALELVEGEDLAQRLARGAIPVDEAIAIAKQIAEGLEAAHEKGIVHRDLKPANIKITSDGLVKILDFGLAKAWEGDPTTSDNALANSPTMARPMTDAGMILGTAAYMSPEQARGKVVDKRSDIWSFGVVLFEMLTGRRLFGGETVSDTLAAVLREGVDLDALPPEMPPSLRRLIARCLDRDPRKRLRDIGEARLTLEAPSVNAIPEILQSSPRTRLAWSVALVSLLALFALAWVSLKRQTSSRGAVRLTFEPPTGVAFDASETDFITVSPNGQMIAFTGRTADGRRQLWLRALGSLDARPLPDSEDPLEPFWSPDSRSIAFGSKGKLRRVDLAGGRAETLADAPRMVGGAWSDQGVIVFSPDWNTPLLRVSADGGPTKPATSLDPASKEVAHRTPVFLPDGRHFLYVSGTSGETRVLIGSLDSSQVTPLLPGIPIARYAPPGWLLFPRDRDLWAQRFDAKTFQLSGDPILIGTSGDLEARGLAPRFNVSETGVLVWQRTFHPEYQLVWYDRSGRRLGEVGAASHVAITMAPKLSPDGRFLAIQIRDPQPDRFGIWTIDLERSVPTRLSSIMGQSPQWSPDGRHVAWVFNRAGVVGIYQKAANGVGDEELVLEAGPRAGGNTFPSDWSADGRFILYTTRGQKTRVDTWVAPLSGDRKPHPLLAGEFDESSSQLSPDGRWVAYRSDVSGTYEIYLQSFTADGHTGREKFRISPNGGSQPRFRRDGKELFYIGADAQLMSVALEPKESALVYGTPKPLFRTRTLPQGAGPSMEYDVTRDGQRFLIGTILDGPNASPPSPVIVLDWTEELKRERQR